MLDDKELESHVQDLLIDICEVMHRHGFDIVPVGALMRLCGVGEDRAKKHDQDYFALDEDFHKILKTRKRTKLSRAPSGVTLH